MLSTLASQPQPITEVAKPVIVSRLRRPALSRRRDDDCGRAHVESFRERVVDGDSVGHQLRHTTASNGCGRAIAPSGTRMKSHGRP